MRQKLMVVAKPGEPTLVMTRDFDAPRRLVFEAWTRPEHVVHWCGPHGYTLPVAEADLRPGGAFRYVNRDPDGNEFPFRGEYREVVPPERLVYTEAFDVEPFAERAAVVTVTFEELDGGRTRVTSTSVYPSAEDRDTHIAFGMEKGNAEAFDRLEDHLVAQAAGETVTDRELIVSRTFEAPSALVFRAWTRPEHLERWWGPTGFTTTTHAFDFRVGGEWRHTMHGPDGTDYPNRAIYQEIVEGDRIRYLHDDGGSEDPHAFEATASFWPEGEAADRTRVVLRLRFRDAAEAAKSRRFGAVEGGQQTLARLSEFVATQQQPAG